MRTTGKDRDGMRITFLALGLGMGKEKPAVFRGVEIKYLGKEVLHHARTVIRSGQDGRLCLSFGGVTDHKERSAGLFP